MAVEIEVEGRTIAFRLDFKHSRWHSLEEPREAVFPLIKVIHDKRYELYSDGSLARVDR